MTDAEFLDALENLTLPPALFDHAAHVRAGYLYSRDADFPEALARMRRAVRNFAVSLGKGDKYHETITVAFMALIREHMHARGDGGDWTGFARANPELFDRNVLLDFFPEALLRSDRAREVFMLPRR